MSTQEQNEPRQTTGGSLSREAREIFHYVRDTYVAKLETLPLRNQFHFLSRCYLWSGNPRYKAILETMRAVWQEEHQAVIDDLSPESLEAFRNKFVPKKEYRRDALGDFAALIPYNRFLFFCLFDRTIFGGTTFEDEVYHVDREHLFGLRKALIANPCALFAISTPAVNFLWLTEYFFPKEVESVPAQRFLEIGDMCALPDVHYDTDARIYFYTHAILGITHFYARPIPTEELSACREMTARVEKIIETHYTDTSLDHKCEFLVCAELCGHSSPLRERILGELMASLSPKRTYFVNTLNSRAYNLKRRTRRKMEHTNVLALMAFLGKEEL